LQDSFSIFLLVIASENKMLVRFGLDHNLELALQQIGREVTEAFVEFAFTLLNETFQIVSLSIITVRSNEM
jgi:hypothetical protein